MVCDFLDNNGCWYFWLQSAGWSAHCSILIFDALFVRICFVFLPPSVQSQALGLLLLCLRWKHCHSGCMFLLLSWFYEPELKHRFVSGSYLRASRISAEVLLCLARPELHRFLLYCCLAARWYLLSSWRSNWMKNKIANQESRRYSMMSHHWIDNYRWIFLHISHVHMRPHKNKMSSSITAHQQKCEKWWFPKSLLWVLR